MPEPTIGRVLLSISSVYAGAGAYVFDWNETHISNPDWPPHAKFHNAQTMSLGVGLSLLSLSQLWAPGTRDRRRALDAGTAAATLYWLTQLSALAYPGTALVDPPKEDAHAQTIVACVWLGIDAVAYVLERRAIRR